MKKNFNVKEMKVRFLAIKDIKIVVFCYLFSILAIVAFVLICFASDRILRASGLLENEIFYWEDIVPIEIITLPDGKVYSYSIDPQILLPQKDQLVSTVRLMMDFEGELGELAAYYKTAGQQDFSVQDRVFGYFDNDGVLFDFGLKNVTEIRIDPASYATTLGIFNSIEINPVRNLSEYFSLNGSTLYFVILIPAMIAASICTIKHVMVNDEVYSS